MKIIEIKSILYGNAAILKANEGVWLRTKKGTQTKN